MKMSIPSSFAAALTVLMLMAPSWVGAQVIVGDGRDRPVPAAPPSSGFERDWLTADAGRVLSLARAGDPQAQLYAPWIDGIDSGEAEAWLDALRRADPETTAVADAERALAAFNRGDVPAGELEKALARAARRDVLAEITLATHRAGGGRRGLSHTLGDTGWLQGRIAAGDRKGAEAACRMAIHPRALVVPLFAACRLLADQGNPEAAYRLGLAHLARADDFDAGLAARIAKALELRTDPAEAARQFRRAAALGHAGAEARLAHLHAIGLGVPRNEAEAARLARSAAEKNDAEGAAVLGLLLMVGRGAPADPASGHTWLRKGAEGGNRMAHYALAGFHLLGRGVPRDFDVALTWLHLARLDRRGTPGVEDYGDLLPLPWPRIVVAANAVRNSAADLTALAKAATLRRRLAESGDWPY